MVVVDGIRYRPEDAPKRPVAAGSEPEAKEARRPRNKSRSVANKEG